MPRRFNSWPKGQSGAKQTKRAVMRGHALFSITETKGETQTHKLMMSMNRVSKQIKKDIQEKNTSTTSVERKAFLEERILKKERIYRWKQIRLEILEKAKVTPKIKRKETLQNNKEVQTKIREGKIQSLGKIIENNPDFQKQLIKADAKIPFRDEPRRQTIVKGKKGQRTIRAIPKTKLFGKK